MTGDTSDSFDAVRTLFKGGGIVFAGVVLELGISFVGKVLIARYLGTASYGGVSIGLTTAAIASTIVLLGLNTGVARHLPRDESRRAKRSTLGSAFRIALPLATVLGVGVALAAPVIATRLFHDPSLGPILRVFALAIPFGATMKLALAAISGEQTALPKVLVQNISYPVTRLLGIGVAIAFGLGTIGVSYAYLASYAAAAVVGCYFLYTHTPLFDTSVSFEGRERELLAFSLPLVVSAAMTIVLADTDMYMLGFLKGTSTVGLYNVAYPLAQLLSTALTSFGFLFMPVISELDAAGASAEMRRLYQLVTKWAVIATLPVFLLFVVFPNLTIRFTFGPTYLEGAGALVVLSTGFFFNAAFGLNKHVLTSMGHTRTLMIDDMVTAAVNVALNLVLIPKYGLIGAAYATTASYVVLNLLCGYQLYSRVGIQPFTRSLVLAPVIGSGALVAIYTLAGAFVETTLYVVIALYLIFLAVYAVAMVRFGIDEEDVRLVLSIEERFGVDLGPVKRVATAIME